MTSLFLVKLARALASEAADRANSPELKSSLAELGSQLDQKSRILEAYALSAEQAHLAEQLRTAAFAHVSTEIGKRIEQARRLKGWNQAECAQAAGISRTALRNVEQQQDSKLSTLVALSICLQVPLTELMQGVQPDLENVFQDRVRNAGQSE